MGKHVKAPARHRADMNNNSNHLEAIAVLREKVTGKDIPGNGKHRAVESFNPMTGKYTHVPADHMPEDAA